MGDTLAYHRGHASLPWGTLATAVRRAVAVVRRALVCIEWAHALRAMGTRRGRCLRRLVGESHDARAKAQGSVRQLAKKSPARLA